MVEEDLHQSLLAKPNVVGVARDPETGVLTAIVSKRVPKSELRAEDLVENAVDEETQVLDADEEEGQEALTPQLLDPDAPIQAYSDRHERHRPVEAGTSEILSGLTAATSGPWPVRVTDTTNGEWSDDVSEGDLVRLSNCHAYADSGLADFGESVLQPSPSDGGDADDETGTLVGYVPLEDGVTVDIAARTSTTRETADPHELPEDWPTGIIRGDYAELAGETFTKTGRTTGVTTGTLRGVGASVRVRYPDPVGVVTLRDLLVFGDISDGGDSGSEIFTGDGELTSVLFAGSQRITAAVSVSNVESEFGVEILTDVPDEGNGDGSPTGGDDSESGSGGEMTLAERTESVLSRVFDAGTVDHPHTYETGRTVDYRATADGRTFAVEVLESESDLDSGLGQALIYAGYETRGADGVAVLVVGSDPDIADLAGVDQADSVHVVHIDTLREFFDVQLGDGDSA